MILPASINNALVTGSGGGDGSGFTEVQATQLLEIYTKLGLNRDDPFTDTPTQFSSQSGSIVIDVTGDGDTTATQTRRT